jgi:hypothetical protein
MLNRKALFVVIIAHLMIALYIITELFFMRYIHYHGQYNCLRPDDYIAEVILPVDYEKISSPDVRQVTLSNGTQKMLSDKGREYILPKYKSVDNGRYYVLTTIKGTAPFVTRWLGDFIFVFTWSMVGLIAGVKVLRSNRSSPNWHSRPRP